MEQILTIYNHEILTGTANWNDQAVALEQYQQRFQDMQQQQFPMIVVEDQHHNKVAGYAYYAAFRSISGYRQSIEHSVFVDPSYARRGLGKALMQQLIHLAIQQNMHIMVAAIDSENMGSIVLHEQLGFVQTGYMPQVGQNLDNGVTWFGCSYNFQPLNKKPLYEALLNCHQLPLYPFSGISAPCPCAIT